MPIRAYRQCRRRLSQTLGLRNRLETPLNLTRRKISTRQVPDIIDIHPEVEHALKYGRPVVALESAIITHGLPYPENLSTAKSLESIVRSTGSTPATIAVVSGRVKIGLKDGELERLADIVGNHSLVKVSMRDISPCIASKKDGGTTCSATSILASLSGIKVHLFRGLILPTNGDQVFSTGGLGGVHWNGQSSKAMDISADLQTLAKYPIALVSAGVKSILDIGRTLEYLETLGVPVISYCQSAFPAFYTRNSGFKSPWRVDSPAEAAAVMDTQWSLNTSTGILFGVPIPQKYENSGLMIQKAVEEAVQEAQVKGIDKLGKAVTPWILNRVRELSGGESLLNNVALIENTTRTGALIAAAYAGLMGFENGNSGLFREHAEGKSSSVTYMDIGVDAKSSANLVVVGASAVDVTSKPLSDERPNLTASTLPGTVRLTCGGVGRNIAEVSHRYFCRSSPRHQVLLLSPIGDDGFGSILIKDSERLGMRTDGLLQRVNKQTATCSMSLDYNGSLVGGIADMDILKTLLPEESVLAIKNMNPKLVVIDANIPIETMGGIIRHCNKNDIPTFYEPTSVPKASSILSVLAAALDITYTARSAVTFTSPNLIELSKLYHRAEEMDLFSTEKWWSIMKHFDLGERWRFDLKTLAENPISENSGRSLSFLIDDGIAHMAIKLLPYFQNMVIKCGNLGVLVAMRITTAQSAWLREESGPYQVISSGATNEAVILRFFPAHKVDTGDIVNVVGAGDSLVGLLCAKLTIDPEVFGNPSKLEACMKEGQDAAILSLTSQNAVSEDFDSIL